MSQVSFGGHSTARPCRAVFARRHPLAGRDAGWPSAAGYRSWPVPEWSGIGKPAKGGLMLRLMEERSRASRSRSWQA